MRSTFVASILWLRFRIVPGFHLQLDSQAATEPPSEAHTASERLVYYKEREIGSGAFSRVFRLIRARDGKFFAAKIFIPPELVLALAFLGIPGH